MTDARRYAPATLRNRDPILAVLRQVLPPTGTVLEIASGSGEHAVHFARELPQLSWQPSDPSPEACASIAAWRAEEGSANLMAPLALDAASNHWPISDADAIVCINMVHISPWEATVGLFTGCAKLLPRGAPLVLYGPYIEDEVETAPSNAEFDRSLKQRSPGWGLRNIKDVDRVAAEVGFERTMRVEMAANNLTVVYQLGKSAD
jgi:cyclopropane fatty-acyl-phospholipid synthase-like methyltransferase